MAAMMSNTDVVGAGATMAAAFAPCSTMAEEDMLTVLPSSGVHSKLFLSRENRSFKVRVLSQIFNLNLGEPIFSSHTTQTTRDERQGAAGE